MSGNHDINLTHLKHLFNTRLLQITTYLHSNKAKQDTYK